MAPRASRLGAAAMGLLLTVSVAGCGDDDEPTAQPAPAASSASPSAAALSEVTISGIDYGYTVSKPEITTGLTRVTFKNDGKDMHMLAVGELKPGKTAADVSTALKTPDEKDDATVFVNVNADEPNVAGEPDILTAGAQVTTYMEFKKAGTYALVCFFPVAGAAPAGPDAPPPSHYERGMINQIVVTDPVGTPAAPPTTPLEATIADGKVTMPAGFTGTGLVKVTNTGKKDHLLLIAKVDEGKTFQQLSDFVDKYFQGQEKLENMPGEFWGGIAGLAPGESALWDAALPPGSYYAKCTESDAEGEGQEHYRSAGEIVAFTVA
ncbi:MAG TPA: hypothetical protein VNA12_08170 [Mycobacteriales bacterium]|nr:hypothetical protein [Mycobacteriales bacterium]